jgi:subtilisin-like proprotein convertase family protein
MKVVLCGLAAVGFLAAVPTARAGTDVRTYSSGTLAARIPDRGRRVFSLEVRDPRPIRWISVRLRIDHPRVSDLSLRLVASDPIVSSLATHVGGPDGASFGAGRHGCRGRLTTISELGRRSIGDAAAPFLGTYAPDDEGGQTENDLLFLDGMSPRGRWKLVVTDSRGGKVGYLRCWQLVIGHATPEVASRRAGHVRAALTWLAIDQQLLGLDLAIWRRGRRIPVGRIPGQGVWCVPRCLRPPGPRSLVVRDLDGDRDPEVMLGLYGSGAHCCAITVVYSYRPGGLVRFARVWDNYAEYRLSDLDHDRIPEFVSADGRFCFSCVYPDVAFPLQIWHFRHGRLVDVTRRFPGAIRRNARSWLEAYRGYSRVGRREEGHPSLDAYVADMALLGEADRGWRAVRAAGRRGELGRHPRRYLRGLRAYLERRGYA